MKYIGQNVPSWRGVKWPSQLQNMPKAMNSANAASILALDANPSGGVPTSRQTRWWARRARAPLPTLHWHAVDQGPYQRFRIRRTRRNQKLTYTKLDS